MRVRSRLLVGLAVAALIVAAASRLWLLPMRVSDDVNEGWNAWHALLVLSGSPLYPPPGGLTGDNYPPLSFLLIAGLTWVTGIDPVFVGRGVSVLGCGLAAAAVHALAARVTAGSARGSARAMSPDRRRAAWLAVLIFAGLAVTLGRRYVAMDDPQWLALSVMLGGVLLLVPRDAAAQPRPVALVGAAAAMVVAGFVKHDLVEVPLAVTVWLVLPAGRRLPHRRLLAIWLLSAAVWLGLGFGLALWAYGWAFVRDLVSADRTFGWLRLVGKSLPVCAVLLPMLLASLWVVRGRWLGAAADPRVRLLAVLASTALAVGCVERGGAGVDVSAHFSAFAAIAVLCGLAGAARPPMPPLAPLAPWARLALCCLVLPLTVAWPVAAVRSVHELSGARRAARDWARSIAQVAAVPGPVACQMATLCVWAGKPYVLDWFLYDQHLRAGGDRDALDGVLAAHRLGGAQMSGVPDGPLATALAASLPKVTTLPLGTVRRP